MKTSLKVEGMHCAACAHRVKSVLEREAGVVQADVSLELGVAQVRHEERVTADELRSAIERAGFTASRRMS